MSVHPQKTGGEQEERAGWESGPGGEGASEWGALHLAAAGRVTGRYQMEVKRSVMVMERHIVYLGNWAQGHHCRWRWGAARNLHKCKFAVQLATPGVNGGLESHDRMAHFLVWISFFVCI